MSKNDIVIGGYYKKPDGEIILTYGCNTTHVQYRNEDCLYSAISKEELVTWERLFIDDFPNAKDPKLPDEFDLLFDIKYTSQLERFLKEESYNAYTINEMLKRYNIKTTNAPVIKAEDNMKQFEVIKKCTSENNKFIIEGQYECSYQKFKIILDEEDDMIFYVNYFDVLNTYTETSRFSEVDAFQKANKIFFKKKHIKELMKKTDRFFKYKEYPQDTHLYRIETIEIFYRDNNSNLYQIRKKIC